MTTCEQPSTESQSERSRRSLVIVPKVRTSLFTTPSTSGRRPPQSPCEHRDRRNADTELPSFFLPLHCRRRGIPHSGTLTSVLRGRCQPVTQSGVLKDSG